MLNSEPQTIVSTSAPAIGNTNVSSRFEILRASYGNILKLQKICRYTYHQATRRELN
jgi:hypothetical protein